MGAVGIGEAGIVASSGAIVAYTVSKTPEFFRTSAKNVTCQQSRSALRTNFFSHFEEKLVLF
jgi:hypothetical protein